ncbi:MAG TPA: hypothetical protein PLZ43_03240 [bacterium]|nr:hypothetical protein [bacterium]
MNRNEFIKGRLLPPLFFFSVFFLSTCAREMAVKKPEKVSFYELCFYLQKVPSETSETDIQNASDHFVNHLRKTGITVLKKKISINSVCYFVDRQPEFSKPDEELQNGISQYIVNAYFNKENSSLHAVMPGRNESYAVYDDIPLSVKLPLYYEINEGLSLTGTNKRLLIISRYLEILKIKHQFGFNEAGNFIINIRPDASVRWMMVPFLYNSLSVDEFIALLPGDYAILKHTGNAKISSKIKMPSWELESIPVGRNQELMSDDAIVFSSGVLSLPFDEEMLMKYFYSLSNSYLLPPFSGLYYSPNFTGASVFPRVLLFSSELAITGESSPAPENILLWALSVDQQIEDYPDTFYSNLLSVKIAKKLYTGTPSFLGGAEIFNATSSVSFEKIRDYLFHKGNVTVFGSLKSSMYLCEDDLISEYPSVIDISKSERAKVYYGSVENSDYSVVSIVMRSSRTSEITDRISRILIENGFSILSTLFEQVSGNDAWGSVSLVISNKDEKKILDLYEKNFKLLDNTVSLGVYRVTKKE